MDFLNSILDNIDEALITTDPRGQILYFNEVALNLSKDVLKSPLQIRTNIVHLFKSGDPVIRDIFRDIRGKRKSFVEYPNHQGSILYLEFNYIPVIDDQDSITHIHIFVRDITPQKIFEKRLMGQAANISNLIEKANAIIIGVDTRGYITDWNDYTSKVTGYEKNEVYAQRFSEVLLSKGDNYFDEMLARVLSEESISNYEMSVKVKSKRKAIFLLNGTPRQSSTAEITGVLLVGQDVTELSQYRKSLEKKVEERTKELQQAIKKEREVVEMKSRFISIASHEFRTPLSSIEHSATYLKNNTSLFASEGVHEKIKTIEKQVNHMVSLLDDVLLYGKSEAGKIQLIKSTINLPEFISKIIEEISLSTKNTHTIDFQQEDLPNEIQTDEKLFRNIFTNLMTNAIKFSPERDCIYLNIVHSNDELIITVSDKGIGIPQEEISRVFEPFIRGTRVGSIQGTGLGLSIVKKAVEILSGEIHVDSIPNVGTTFIVKIPTHEST
jgi:PAS domain S-box-containing protein